MILSNKIKFVGYGNGIAYVRVKDLKSSMKKIKKKLCVCLLTKKCNCVCCNVIDKELGAELI